MSDEKIIDFTSKPRHEPIAAAPIKLTRQLDLISTDVLGLPITMIGAGAVGSFAALALTKMGFGNMRVFDFDRIEEENLGSQFYRRKDLGRPKVEALKEILRDFSDAEIEIVNGKYEKGSFAGIVISAVDSMAVRKLIWENHKGNYATKAVIDPRMAAEEALLYVMVPTRPKDLESYENTLYDDKSAVQERCTAKATVYTAALLGSWVAKAVKDLAVGSASYPRVTQWSIAKSHMLAFLNEKPAPEKKEVESEVLGAPGLTRAPEVPAQAEALLF